MREAGVQGWTQRRSHCPKPEAPPPPHPAPRHHPPVHLKAVRVLLGDGERAQHVVVRGNGDGEEGVQVARLVQRLVVNGQAGRLLLGLDAVVQAGGLL